ncbi:MAG: hypothetical protein P4L46_15285 [Fimbriimonas sp.]|nr:hypothetical protein [Fimbriimonas sp.]
MPSSDTPSINVIALASDDDLWVVQTDLSGLRTVLEDPAGFVRTHVSINGEPGNLVQPFVIVFQEIPARKGGPDVLIQGINHTAMLSVKFSEALEAEDDGVPIHPADQVHAVLRHGNAVYSHLEMAGMDRTQVAASIVKSITSLPRHFESLNGLAQTHAGASVEASKKLRFTHNPAAKPQFVYQGAVNPPAALASITPGGADQACTMSTGDANDDGQVVVNGVVIKTYVQ